MLAPRQRRVVAAPLPKKRRKRDATTEEIPFDFDARQDYLTGFHKRKLQRIKLAKEQAVKKEKEAKLSARKAVRLTRFRSWLADSMGSASRGAEIRS